MKDLPKLIFTAVILPALFIVVTVWIFETLAMPGA